MPLSKYVHVSLNPAGSQIITYLIQIVYVLQPFGFVELTLPGILLDSRRHNERDDVTGALVCRHDIYLQPLEGRNVPVRAAYARICQDDPHAGVRELLNRKTQCRLFANWAMLHEAARTWIWRDEEIADAALDRAEPAEIIKAFKGPSDQSAKPTVH